ncbi:hypothetical protein MPSEU_000731000 [Mayamaea pseudoterrestris]|nr:hypothetical protein MPSEU_000731000 [Mayamaea pseudoterrestris]
MPKRRGNNESSELLRRSKRLQEQRLSRRETSPSKPGDRPISITKRLRTASLCLNRFLHEEDLTGMIQEYYRGTVMSDVLERTAVIFAELMASSAQSDRSSIQALQQELIGYSVYYSESNIFVAEIMRFFSLGNRGNLQMTQRLMDALFETCLSAAMWNPVDLGVCFIFFACRSIESMDYDVDVVFSEWNVRYAERLLDSHAVDLLLLMANDLETYLGPVDDNMRHMVRVVYKATEEVLCFLAMSLSVVLSAHLRRDVLLPQLDDGLNTLHAGIQALTALIGDGEDESNASDAGGISDSDEEGDDGDG